MLLDDYLSYNDICLLMLSLMLQANVVLKVLVVTTKPILVKQRCLTTMVREHLSGNSAILSKYFYAIHVTILPLIIFIFCHMAAMTVIIK